MGLSITAAELTLVRRRDHPAHAAHAAGLSYDAFKRDAAAQVEADCIGRRVDEEVVERVVLRVDEQRVVE